MKKWLTGIVMMFLVGGMLTGGSFTDSDVAYQEGGDFMGLEQVIAYQEGGDFMSLPYSEV